MPTSDGGASGPGDAVLVLEDETTPAWRFKQRHAISTLINNLGEDGAREISMMLFKPVRLKPLVGTRRRNKQTGQYVKK